MVEQRRTATGKNRMRIRTATQADSTGIRKLHLSAFSAEERDSVAGLAVALLGEQTTPPIVSLVAVHEEFVVGHAAFSPLRIASEDLWHGSILAPLGVAPEFQGRGIGAQLIEAGQKRLRKRGEHMLFVYGDPGYYGRFGFSSEAASPYLPPYEIQYPFGWQAVMLNQGGRAAAPVRLACVSSLAAPELW